MPDWKQVRWHLCFLLLGLGFISLVLCLEFRHLSEGDHSDVRGLPHSSSDPGTIRGQEGSGRPAPIDFVDSMAERNMVTPDSGVMGSTRDRLTSGELPGIPETLPVKEAGYPVERVSPGLGQTGGGALSGKPTGPRSIQSSTMSPPVVLPLASSAVRDVNPGGTLATPSGNKVANNGVVTGGVVTGSLGEAGSPSETPASSVSPISPTALAESTDPTSQNDGAGKAVAVRQATAEELYRTKYGWAVYGEFIRRRTIDQHNGIAPTDVVSPPLD
jgi:hypothetical protein